LSTELASKPCTPGGAATTLPGSGISRPRCSVRLTLSVGQGVGGNDRLSDPSAEAGYLVTRPSGSRELEKVQWWPYRLFPALVCASGVGGKPETSETRLNRREWPFSVIARCPTFVRSALKSGRTSNANGQTKA
jgi:hypothetical protein